jgi:hypothetical protein
MIVTLRCDEDGEEYEIETDDVSVLTCPGCEATIPASRMVWVEEL